MSAFLLAWGAGWTAFWGVMFCVIAYDERDVTEASGGFGVSFIGLLISVCWMFACLVFRWAS